MDPHHISTTLQDPLDVHRRIFGVQNGSKYGPKMDHFGVSEGSRPLRSGGLDQDLRVKDPEITHFGTLSGSLLERSRGDRRCAWTRGVAGTQYALCTGLEALQRAYGVWTAIWTSQKGSKRGPKQVILGVSNGSIPQIHGIRDPPKSLNWPIYEF